VIVETSGLADPGPVAQTLYADQALARDFKLGPIVTVVDALIPAPASLRRNRARADRGAMSWCFRRSIAAADASNPSPRCTISMPGCRCITRKIRRRRPGSCFFK
jgi:hypothetical protein